MKKIVSFVLALMLCLGLSVSASATTVKSNQGGNNGGAPTAPKTGSAAVAVLSIAACTAGGVGVATYKKSKEQ